MKKVFVLAILLIFVSIGNCKVCSKTNVTDCKAYSKTSDGLNVDTKKIVNYNDWAVDVYVNIKYDITLFKACYDKDGNRVDDKVKTITRHYKETIRVEANDEKKIGIDPYKEYNDYFDDGWGCDTYEATVVSYKIVREYVI